MRFERGDIVLVAYPNSDLSTTKQRPALVVQSDNLNTGLPQTIIAMITSNLSRAGHPSRVSIAIDTRDDQQTGLISESVIMTDNLATVRETEIIYDLGRWRNMALVDDALCHTLGVR